MRLFILPVIFLILSTCLCPAQVGKVNNPDMPAGNLSAQSYLINIDGLYLLDPGSIGSLQIDSSSIRDYIFNMDTIYDDEHNTKYAGCIMVRTKENINGSLKYIMHKNEQWIRTHPFSLIILNELPLKDDLTRYNNLTSLDPDDIAEITFYDPDKAVKKFGKTGVEGVVVIKTK